MFFQEDIDDLSNIKEYCKKTIQEIKKTYMGMLELQISLLC